MAMVDKIEIPQDERAVANYILDIAPKYGIDDLSPMKLMKFIFLAHGWSLYFLSVDFLSVPLINEEQQPEAWDYGPVYPKVYQAIKKYIAEPVRERIINRETNFPYGYKDTLPSKQKDVIKAVLLRYKDKTAFQLSGITNLKDSPWYRAVKNKEQYISRKSMEDYYTKIAQEIGL